MTIADSTPALPPNTPLWVVILVAALPVVGALGAALAPWMLRSLSRRKRRKSDAERALIRAELGDQPKLATQLDTGMQLVEDLVRDLQNRVQRLEMSRDELQRRLDEVEHDLARRDVEIAELRAKIDRVTRERDDALREIDRLKAQLDALTMSRRRGP